MSTDFRPLTPIPMNPNRGEMAMTVDEDEALRKMFEEGVASGEWEVAERDENGVPIAWRLTDRGQAQALREEGKLQ